MAQKTLFEAWRGNNLTEDIKEVTNPGRIHISTFDDVVQIDDDDDDILLAAESANVVGGKELTEVFHSASVTESFKTFDFTAGESYYYPTNYPVREYQFNIVRESLFKNTLVCLPTGLGKTFIAAVVMYNFYRWYPRGKVIFLAPTKPLVSQQMEACWNTMGIPEGDTVEMTGHMAPAKRELLWKSKRVFFMTPQVLQNDLGRGLCCASDLVCLVFDEAHKALGNHAYCQVVRELLTTHVNFRVLALSATPGDGLEAVQQVVDSLLISHVELRTEESLDIRPYTHQRLLEKIVVPLSEDIKTIRSCFLKVIGEVTSRLHSQHVLWISDPEKIAKFTLLKARDQFRKRGTQDVNKARVGAVESDFALAISFVHALELLVQHGLLSFYRFMRSKADGQKGFARAKLELSRHPELLGLLEELEVKIEPSTEGDQVSIGENFKSKAKSPKSKMLAGFIPSLGSFISHPKLKKLEDIILKHFHNHETVSSFVPLTDNVERRFDGPSTRAMIFSQLRDSVHEITAVLSRHTPLVRVMSFIGQSSVGKSARGLTQKEQAEVVSSFRGGGYNTLVATSVGEEGLDIGDVDLIVCFDASSSPIRLVQRMGRTGRKRAGRIVVLVTEGKEEQVYQRGESSKKNIHKYLNNPAKSLQLYQHSPRMIPPGLSPVCIKMPMVTGPEQTRRRTKQSKTSKKIPGSKQGSAYQVDASGDTPLLAVSLEEDQLEMGPWCIKHAFERWKQPVAPRLFSHVPHSKTTLAMLAVLDGSGEVSSLSLDQSQTEYAPCGVDLDPQNLSDDDDIVFWRKKNRRKAAPCIVSPCRSAVSDSLYPVDFLTVRLEHANPGNTLLVGHEKSASLTRSESHPGQSGDIKDLSQVQPSRINPGRDSDSVDNMPSRPLLPGDSLEGSSLAAVKDPACLVAPSSMSASLVSAQSTQSAISRADSSRTGPVPEPPALESLDDLDVLMLSQLPSKPNLGDTIDSEQPLDWVQSPGSDNFSSKVVVPVNEELPLDSNYAGSDDDAWALSPPVISQRARPAASFSAISCFTDQSGSPIACESVSVGCDFDSGLARLSPDNTDLAVKQLLNDQVSPVSSRRKSFQSRIHQTQSSCDSASHQPGPSLGGPVEVHHCLDHDDEDLIRPSFTKRKRKRNVDLLCTQSTEEVWEPLQDISPQASEGSFHFKRPRGPRQQHTRNPFIDDEADLPDYDRDFVSSDEHDSYESSPVQDSFLDDATQRNYSQSDNMQAIYCQSLLSPIRKRLNFSSPKLNPQQNRFRLAKPNITRLPVGKIVDEEVSSPLRPSTPDGEWGKEVTTVCETPTSSHHTSTEHHEDLHNLVPNFGLFPGEDSDRSYSVPSPDLSLGFDDLLRSLRAASTTQALSSGTPAPPNMPTAATSVYVVINTKAIPNSLIPAKLRSMPCTVVIVQPQLGCDYLVSRRTGVERISYSDACNPVHSSQTVQRLQQCRAMYGKVLLCVERTKRKNDDRDMNSVPRVLAKLLVKCQVQAIRVLFTSSEDHTTRLVHALAAQETTLGFGLQLSTEFVSRYQQRIDLLTCIPHVNFPLAVTLLRSVGSLESLFACRRTEDLLAIVPHLQRSVAKDIVTFITSFYNPNMVKSRE